MSSNEKLHFKIGLSGTYWDKRPFFIVGVNDTPGRATVIEADSDVIQYIEFDAEVADGENVLKIVLNNKDNTDVVKDSYEDPNKFNIVKDMLLNIHSVEIDDIDLGQIAFLESVFKLDQPQNYQGQTVTEIPCCMNLGFNGTWELRFESPFYLWLLEKM